MMLSPALTVQFCSYYLAIPANEEGNWNQVTISSVAINVTHSAQVNSQPSWTGLRGTGKLQELSLCYEHSAGAQTESEKLWAKLNSDSWTSNIWTHTNLEDKSEHSKHNGASH